MQQNISFISLFYETFFVEQLAFIGFMKFYEI